MDYARMTGRPVCGSHVPAEVRTGFIEKVYGILAAQLAVTVSVAAPVFMLDAAREYVDTQLSAYIFIGVLILNILTIFIMTNPCCGKDTMRRVPLNYILIFVFTITEGLLVGCICCSYDTSTVLAAMLLTVGSVACLAMYATLTESDFTFCGAYLFCAVLGLSAFGVMLLFVQSPFTTSVYSGLGILLFSFYLVFDIQMTLGGKNDELTEDDYMLGALTLYTDIIQLFLYILQCLGTSED